MFPYLINPTKNNLEVARKKPRQKGNWVLNTANGKPFKKGSTKNTQGKAISLCYILGFNIDAY